MGRFSFLCALCVGILITIISAQGTGCSPGYFITDSGNCKKCPKGTYQPEADKYGCVPCPDGKVSTEEGNTKCISCVKNAAPNEHKTMCECIFGAVWRGDRKTCTLCKPGTSFFISRRIRDCFDCDSGFYQPESGKTSCIRCPQGSSSGPGAVKCIPCSEDELLLEGKICGTCPAGETKSQHGSFCGECDGPTFKGEKGIHPCEFCPAGEQPNGQKTACVPMTCPTGEALLKKGKKMRCGKCPAGSYYDEKKLKCSKCLKNYYMPHENVDYSCYRCPEHEFTSKVGAAECSRCPQGQRIFKDGKCGTCPGGYVYEAYKGSCKPCGINTYSDGKMESCEICPTGLYSLPKASRCFSCSQGQALLSSTRKCGVCPAGTVYYKGSGSCGRCYKRAFKSTPGNGSCYACPEGTVANKKRTACISE